MPRRLPPRQTAAPFVRLPPAFRTEAPLRLASCGGFVAGVAVLVLLSHAAAYLVHEYCHSIMAWLLGFKQNPLALHYGPPTLANILFQQEVDENVDYDPIFAGGHDAAAALIAFAGPGIGNGAAYGLFLLLFRRRVSRRPDALAWLLFFLALFSAGNVWSYAPTRTITTHGDMALLARGLHVGVWALLPIVSVPSLLILRSVFLVLFPSFRSAFLSDDPFRLVFVSVLVGWVYFGFFGGLDLAGHYGPVPAALSVVSVLLLLPTAVTWCILGGWSALPVETPEPGASSTGIRPAPGVSAPVPLPADPRAPAIPLARTPFERRRAVRPASPSSRA
ncbi:MAG: hypothetical protein INR65_13535 [Gluconacetobacter diazotrophicus]|nr:hypothetical protein [Gluconacetobacter diazotrophicus]